MLRRLDADVVDNITISVSSLDQVVLELVQNSLDAGAGRIVVTVDWATLSLMVQDDGSGMTSAQLDQLGRYKTNKLRQLLELAQLRTYGFKGQFLHMLRHASRTHIVSRAGSEESIIRHQETHSQRFDFDDEDTNPKTNNRFYIQRPHTTGTVVISYDMYYNMPVRQRQIHRLGVNRFIKDTKRALVIINRPVDLQVNVDGVVKIDLRRTQTLLLGLFGVPKLLVSKIKGKYGPYQILGCLSQEFERGRQFVLLNSRVYRVDLGYRKYPLFIINITISPQNISELFQDPTKQVWTSKHEEMVRKIVSKVLGRFYLELVIPGSPKTLPKVTPKTSPKKQISPTKKHPNYTNISIGKEDLKQFQIVGQVSNQFILVTFNNQLHIVDQHAMDERIRVEQLYQQLHLECPLLECYIEIPPEHLLVILEYQFYVSQFFKAQYSVQSAAITHIPQILHRLQPHQILQGILEYINDVRDLKKFKLTDDWFTSINSYPAIMNQAINSMACRLAIMFGDGLTEQQMVEGVGELGRCRIPFLCAHGRPAIVPLALALGPGPGPTWT